MNLDPTMLEALVTAVLTLLGVRAGYGVGRRNAGGEGDESVESQAAVELAAKMGELSARVDRVVGEIERIEEQERQRGRILMLWRMRWTLVTHIGGMRSLIDGR